MNRCLKIAFIGGRGVVSKYSGIETYYEEVGKILSRMNYNVTVYCRYYFTPKLKKYNGIHIVRIPTIQTKHLETFLHSLLSTIHAVFHNYNIIHYHTLGPSLFSFIPRLLGIKTVVSVQGLDWKREKWNWFARYFLKICEMTAIKFPNKTIVVSKILKNYFEKKYNKDSYYIPNGVHLPKPLKPNLIKKYELKEKEYILYVGRLSPEKNCHLLIDAYKQINSKKKLVFAGGSSHSEDYVRILRKEQNNKIIFLGYVTSKLLSELLSNAYIFVLPSSIEGLSIALLEALSYGNCVLTSDIPENLELIDDVGFSFKNNDIKDLKNKLNYLIQNEIPFKLISNKAKELVKYNYTWDIVASSTAKLYMEIK